MKVKLEHPITIPKTIDRPETEIKELDLVERMKAKHGKLIPDDCFQGGAFNPVKFVPVIAAMASIPLSAAEDIDYVDLVKIVGEIVMPFLSELAPPEAEQEK